MSHDLPPNSIRPQARGTGEYRSRALAEVPAWMQSLLRAVVEDVASSYLPLVAAEDREPGHRALHQMQEASPALVARLRAALEPTPAEGAAAAAAKARPEPTLRELSLVDDGQIDADIEVAGLAQAIEASAEVELIQLTALCSGLAGAATVDVRHVPLRPLLVAKALRGGVTAWALPPAMHRFVMKSLRAALGPTMRAVYADDVGWLESRQVAPTTYHSGDHAMSDVPARPGRTRAAAAPRTLALVPTGAAADEGGPATSALQRLVRTAQTRMRADAAPAAAPPSSAGRAAPLRLLDEPATLAGTAAPLTPEAGSDLMARLLAQMQAAPDLAPSARTLLAALDAPARALAAQDPGLWQQPGHPWWQLLDRVAVLGAVHDEHDAGQEAAARHLATSVLSMLSAPTLDRQACQAASDEVLATATRLCEARSTALDVRGAELQRLESAIDAEEVERQMRDQIVQQLRSTPAAPELRQFLVGPWTRVLAQASLRHGTDGAELDRLALVVDDLLAATAQAGRAVSKAQRTVLLRQVHEGLRSADFGDERIEAIGADLAALLRHPPAPREEPFEEPAETIPVGHVVDLHGGLPTVPLAMDAVAAHADASAWLETLAPGSTCRLFLLGRWMTAQASWVGASRNLFLFSSRHGGRTHSLTRRMLLRLREAGLATVIESGLLVAQAMDTLTHSDLGTA